jgi:tetratricopeptide (TPR) repeat protein
MIAVGERLKERYRLERLLGRGGMASVWLANDEVLDRPVAIKVLADTIASDPAFLARFRREARVAASLSHPNLIGVYDYAEADERPYLVMEYVPGVNLAQRTARGAAIDCERLARELLDALAHIHAVGILHRDVKPGNVLIAADESAKLIDFGIALPKDATALTHTGLLLGTASYIAPEVMGGEPATERSDLYSCGLVLRDCMAPESPDHLRALVDRLMAAEPGERPSSARAARAQLEREAQVPEQATEAFTPTLSHPREEPPPARRPPSPPLATRTLEPGPSRFPWGRAAAAVAALALVAAAFLVLGNGSDEAPRERQANAGANVAADDRQADRGGSDRSERPEATASEETEATGSAEPESSAEAEPEAAATVPEPSGEGSAAASSLNQQGFELIQAGAYDEAVPVLEEAVSSFPPGTEDLDYAYALFNLGNALRLSGRPDEAIPVLERRLEIPNQTEVVSRELDAARSEAGQ